MENSLEVINLSKSYNQLEQKIYFGLLTNIHEKLDNLYQFYKQVMPVKGWQTYRDISVKYNNQIVCTKK